MKPLYTYLAALLCVAASPSAIAVPTLIAQESFEGVGIGFTTSAPQFFETSISTQTDFFSVIPNNGTKIEPARVLAGADGAFIFCVEDIDSPRTGGGIAVPAMQSLTTNAVNIAGKINNQVRIKLAAPGRSTDPAQYENFGNAPTAVDFIRVDVSIDGGAFQRIAQFSPSVFDFPSTLTFDADGNNLGDSTVNPLTAAFQDFTYAIPTGNTVAVKVTLHSNATGEYIAFDDIRIFGESAATNPPVIAGVPAPNLIFTEGGAAAALAPALTVSDTDSANLTSASVIISQALASGEDVLAANPSGALLAGNIAYTAATGTLAITGSAPIADYQAVLRSVTYRNTNLVNPSTSVRRVTFLTSDGINPSNSPIRDINVVDNIATQSIPFVESFETDGRGTRYSVDGGFSSPPSMFARTQPGAVAGLDGTFAFGVENVDDNPDFTELVTFNLNATALANITGELRVAAGGGAVYDNNATVPDFLRVEVSADGGPFQNVLAFYPDSAAQGNMRQDTTPGDATNLGNGTLLTAALQTFTFNLPSANALTVRIRAFTNIVGENILFDRLALQGTPLSAPTIVSATQSGVTTTTATLGGNVTADGGTAILGRGVVLAKTADDSTPTIGEPNVTNVPNGTNSTGIFTINATGLMPGTPYTFAAYATNSVGTSYTSVGTFTTSALPPTVTAISPSSGTTLGGTNVTITGTDFTGASAVTIGGTAATIGTISPTEITATTSAHGAGVVDVAVTTPGGTGTGTGLFTYVLVPTDPVLTLLAKKGGAVPGAGSNGIPAAAIWVSFGAPSINDEGKGTVLATYKDGTVSTTAIFGFDVADLPGTMRIVAKKGGPAPGITNAVMSTIKDPLLAPDGSIAWLASLSNAPKTTGAVATADNSAIYLDADGAGPGAAVIVARKGGVATGAAAAAVVPPGVDPLPEWGSFISVAMDSTCVAFTATLASKTTGLTGAPGPGGVTKLDDSGVWVFDRINSATALALREGGPLLGSTIKTINALVARPGSPGQGNGVAHNGTDYLMCRVTLADKRLADGYINRTGTSGFPYVTGGSAPDYGAGALWQSFGIPTQSGASTAMAFLGTVKSLTGTATAANNVAIFAEDDAFSLARIVSKGDGAGISGGIFSALKDPVNAANRSVAFFGTMKTNTPAGIGATNNDGIWRSDSTNGLSLVAREGAQPPEAPAGAQWKKFSSLALPEGSRGPIFVAAMHSKTGTVAPGPGNIFPTNDVGLWATDSLGSLRLLLQEGDLIGTSMVKTFSVLSSVPGSPAQTRSFNGGGGVIVKATDTLGAQHLIHIAVP